LKAETDDYRIFILDKWIGVENKMSYSYFQVNLEHIKFPSSIGTSAIYLIVFTQAISKNKYSTDVKHSLQINESATELSVTVIQEVPIIGTDGAVLRIIEHKYPIVLGKIERTQEQKLIRSSDVSMKHALSKINPERIEMLEKKITEEVNKLRQDQNNDIATIHEALEENANYIKSVEKNVDKMRAEYDAHTLSIEKICSTQTKIEKSIENTISAVAMYNQIACASNATYDQQAEETEAKINAHEIRIKEISDAIGKDTNGNVALIEQKANETKAIVDAQENRIKEISDTCNALSIQVANMRTIISAMQTKIDSKADKV